MFITTSSFITVKVKGKQNINIAYKVCKMDDIRPETADLQKKWNEMKLNEIKLN